jgi:hypothetical protein
VHTHCYRTRRHLKIRSQLVSQPLKHDIIRGTRALQALATSNPDADEAAAVGAVSFTLGVPVPVLVDRQATTAHDLRIAKAQGNVSGLAGEAEFIINALQGPAKPPRP